MRNRYRVQTRSTAAIHAAGWLLISGGAWAASAKPSNPQALVTLLQSGQLQSVAEPAMPIPLGMAKLKHTQILQEIRAQRAIGDVKRTAILATVNAKIPESSVAPPKALGFSEVSGLKNEPTIVGYREGNSPSSLPHGKPVPAPGSQRVSMSEFNAVKRLDSVSPQVAPQSTPSRATISSTATLSVPSNTYSTQLSASAALAGVCRGPTISGVNGHPSLTWFTPEPAGNQYVIEGCGFGAQQGEAHIYGPFAAPVVGLTIQYWSDTAIIATMDANFSGEPDHVGNVNLVVAPVGGAQARASGFSFYAMRDQVLLGSVPENQTLIALDTDTAGNPVPHYFESPENPLYRPSGSTLDVARYENGRFGSTHDAISFNNLAAGFYVEQIAFYHDDMTVAACTGSQSTSGEFDVDGHWGASWDANSNILLVTTQEEHCHNVSDIVHHDPDWSLSTYILSAWVVGPKGVNPWPANVPAAFSTSVGFLGASFPY